MASWAVARRARALGGHLRSPGPSSVCRERDRTSSEGSLWGSDEVALTEHSVPPTPHHREGSSVPA